MSTVDPQGDFESKFYKELGQIDIIKDKIDKLQSGYKKLSNRIDQIEILGLQEQLNSINDTLLETQRTLARYMIIADGEFYDDVVKEQKPNLYNSFHSQLIVDIGKATTKAKTSNEPLIVRGEFAKSYSERTKEMGIILIDVS